MAWSTIKAIGTACLAYVEDSIQLGQQNVQTSDVSVFGFFPCLNLAPRRLGLGV